MKFKVHDIDKKQLSLSSVLKIIIQPIATYWIQLVIIGVSARSQNTTSETTNTTAESVASQSQKWINSRNVQVGKLYERYKTVVERFEAR